MGKMNNNNNPKLHEYRSGKGGVDWSGEGGVNYGELK